MISGFFKAFRSRRHRLALFIAMAVDTIQIVLLPFFAEGAASPADTVLDVITAGVMTRLIGWHWAFLPTLFAELIPAFDLFPTWTMAVLYVSSQTPLPSESAEPVIDVDAKVYDAKPHSPSRLKS